MTSTITIDGTAHTLLDLSWGDDDQVDGAVAEIDGTRVLLCLTDSGWVQMVGWDSVPVVVSL